MRELRRPMIYTATMTRTVVAGAVALLGPLMLFLAYLSVAHAQAWRSPAMYWAAFAAAVLVGVLALWLLPRPSKWWKAAITPFYAAGMAIFILINAIAAGCAWFNECM